MPKTSKTLTPNELNHIAQRRAQAKRLAMKQVEAMLPEEAAAEEAAIQAGIDQDADARELTDADFASMRPAHEVHPELVATKLRNKGGRPRLAAPKTLVTVRIDADVLARLKADGAGWQTRMNSILRDATTGRFKSTNAATSKKRRAQ